jgi:hypothetical protein
MKRAQTSGNFKEIFFNHIFIIIIATIFIIISLFDWRVSKLVVNLRQILEMI